MGKSIRGGPIGTSWCDADRGVRASSSSSTGVTSGDGEGRVTRAMKQGALWGSGEMSMRSMPGEEDGMGGVVAPSWSTGGVTRKSTRMLLLKFDRALFGTYHCFLAGTDSSRKEIVLE